jgi:phage terminase small subunit
MAKDKRTLSPKQKLFIDEYLKCFNATEAARRAGYSGGDNVLSQRGYELVRNSEIAEIISKRLQASAMSADEVLMRLGELARSEYEDYLMSDGNVDLPSLLAAGKGHLIKSVKPGKYGAQIEFYDADKSLALIAKHHGLLIDRQQSTNLEIDLNTLTDEQLKRLAAGENVVDILADK